MNWEIKSFSELRKEELYAILQIRNEVFVVEQNCPYQDLDDKDFDAIHLFAYDDSQMAAYCRILLPGKSFEEASIGRVLTRQKYRKTGLGFELMQKAIAYIQSDLLENSIKIGAQSYLQRFYESFGFRKVSEIYLEDNIPHIEMVLQ